MIVLILIFSFLLLHYIAFLISISKGLKNILEKIRIKSNNEFISVIIPFRNEKENIIQNLNSITSQNFPHDRYEIIYIDDNSDDGSSALLANIEKPSNVRILNSPVDLTERGHKKKALKYAIENSLGEIIITTDADCTYESVWLKKMSAFFDDHTAFVSGPVEFISNGNLFEELQKLEFSSLILVGAGLIGIKKPIICNAANLGFRKSVFYEVGGYDDNLDLSSGDDEFLMQKIARKTNYKVKFCFDKGAIAYTKPNKSIKEFYQQRKRWASKGFYYTDKMITLKLIFIFLFYLGIPTQIILGIFYNQIFIVSSIITFLIKTLFEYRIVQKDSDNLFPKTSCKYFLIAEIFHIPYILISGVTGIFGNYKWKGREIKR